MLLRGARPVLLEHPDFYVRRSEEDRISQRHFEEAHVHARAAAVDAIWMVIKEDGKLRSALSPHVRAFSIRNQLQLIDGAHSHLCWIFTESAAGKSLLTVLDRLVLAWIRRVGPSWHWHTRVRKLTANVWSGLAYDNHRKTGFMQATWQGSPPQVSTENMNL